MLDVEYVKVVLQDDVDKREEAKAKLKKYRVSGNKALEDCYEKRYNMYRFRFDGMRDLLYDLGFIVWVNYKNEVCVEKRVTYDDLPF